MNHDPKTEAVLKKIERLADELASVTRHGTDLLTQLVAAERELRDLAEGPSCN